MRSIMGHPVLDLFRAMEGRTRASASRAEIEQATHLPLSQELNGVLLFLAARGPLTVTEIAGTLGVTVASASRYVSSLESWGLVSKARAVDDARAVKVHLAPEGRDLRQRNVERWAQVVRGVMDKLDPRHVEALESLLPRLQDGLRPDALFASLPPAERDEAGDVVARITTWVGVATRQASYTAAVLQAVGGDLAARELLFLRIVGSEREASTRRVAELAQLDRSSVSRVIAKLTSQVLLYRRSEGNGVTARVSVSLSFAGRRVLLAAEARELAAVEAAMLGWTSAEVDRLLAAIAGLAAALDR